MTYARSPDALVLRSHVVSVTEYGQHLKSLRYDFFNACAYCFTAEQEAHGISFEIDHYLPKKDWPNLINDYDNLMYSCKICNQYKGSRASPGHDLQIGWRFFRTDFDFFGDHYTLSGNEIAYKTAVGEYTIEYLYLNRSSLKRLRDFRQRVAACDEYISIGMLWLKNFHIDRLPQNFRLRGKSMISEAIETAEHVKSSADLVRRLNRSDLIDPEDDAELRERKRRLKLFRDRMIG